ncbi:ras association domain-containing protein 6-like isoform X3 [Myxocyprinus asiaticus]|uniref:ras association domain-containing protein 6-like isoform X3 n=1 Tax=Myxocyprinus asiaticus TaxID=70543 RepID=UPI00222332BD|nr:ras association domain-containing protein 6-like isoform X3 [Myxocyprinus asiaticus]XP_051539302.1 ras association domain-containing protein 6-like isoform X3 [Myxocyprinus asiaticus]
MTSSHDSHSPSIGCDINRLGWFFEMNAGQSTCVVEIGEGKSCSRAEFSSLLNTYNCFLNDKTHLKLNVCENAGQVTFEGILVISWGVKRPIRLKIQDEKQIFPNESPVKSPDPISPLGSKRGMTRWGEFDDLHHIDELEEVIQDGSKKPDNPTEEYTEYESKTLRLPRPKSISGESSNLFRTMSDASLVKMRVKSKKTVERQKNRNHRFSINGHFYNHMTSIFTPSYGATTNVHINSKMTTHKVITQLLHKFKIENSPNEFALYCIHQSGEKKRLSSSDLPLWERLLQGPSNRIMKMFLMDADEQEISLDVAQYLNLELPILRVILQKLEEQENQELQRIISNGISRTFLLGWPRCSTDLV